MAARNRVKDLQAVANCSLCQDYFKDPVILKCGHNFCRACIIGYCEFGDFMDISPPSYPCPLCREVFGEGEFQPNRQLRNIVDIAKKIPEPRGRSECKEHGKLLKLFCEVDETPICLVCGESPAHKEHRVAPADEAALDYKARIQSRLEILKKEREEILSFKLSEENESRELLKWLQTEKQMIVSEFQQLHPFREEQERLLLAQLEELNKAIEKRRDEYVAKLSEELFSFSFLISEMEQKCQQPASEFLQDIKVTLSRCERKKFQNPVAFSSELKRRIWESSQRNAALKTIVKEFKDQKETSLVRSWLPRRTTWLQDRFSMEAKWSSSTEDLDKAKWSSSTEDLDKAKWSSSTEDLDKDSLSSYEEDSDKEILWSSEEDLDTAELRSLAPQLQSLPSRCELPREQHQSSYLWHGLSSRRPTLRRSLSSPMATVSHQMQALTALPWPLKGDSSGMKTESIPLLRQRKWAPESASTSMILSEAGVEERAHTPKPPPPPRG